MIVYLITNLVNGKYYVGQTVKSIRERWWQYSRKASAKRRETDQAIYKAIRKYGMESFTIQPLVYATSKQELDALERMLIRALKSNDRRCGYNLSPGGEGGPIGNKYGIGNKNSLGTKPSLKTRKKMSDSQKSFAATSEGRSARRQAFALANEIRWSRAREQKTAMQRKLFDGQ